MCDLGTAEVAAQEGPGLLYRAPGHGLHFQRAWVLPDMANCQCVCVCVGGRGCLNLLLLHRNAGMPADYGNSWALEMHSFMGVTCSILTLGYCHGFILPLF